MTTALPEPVERAFASFDRYQVRFLVLRGYTPLSDLATAADIDILVHPKDVGNARIALREAGWLRRRLQTGVAPHEFFDFIDGDGRFCYMLDVLYGLSYGGAGYELRGLQVVFETVRRRAGVPVPNPSIALFLFALHVLLDKGSLSAASLLRAERMAEDARIVEPSDILTQGFGTDAADLVAAFLQLLRSGGSDVAGLQARATNLAAMRTTRMRRRFDRIRVALVRSRARPFRVAVVGMDGSGKSTVIQEVLKAVHPLPCGAAYLGYNQFALPMLRAIIVRVAELQSVEPQSLQLRVLDKLREVLLPLDILIRIVRAEPGMSLVLYDRYPFQIPDESGGSRRPGLWAMALFWRVALRALPQPDLLLLCDGDPHVIWARKQEYPFADFERGRAQLHRLFNDARIEKLRVRTDVPLSETLTVVLAAFAGSLRFRRRVYLS